LQKEGNRFFPREVPQIQKWKKLQAALGFELASMMGCLAEKWADMQIAPAGNVAGGRIRDFACEKMIVYFSSKSLRLKRLEGV